MRGDTLVYVLIVVLLDGLPVVCHGLPDVTTICQHISSMFPVTAFGVQGCKRMLPKIAHNAVVMSATLLYAQFLGFQLAAMICSGSLAAEAALGAVTYDMNFVCDSQQNLSCWG